MKKISVLMVTLLMTAAMAMAQRPRQGGGEVDPKVRAERMTERMVKEYSLNEVQKKQLLELNLSLTEKAGERPVPNPEGNKSEKTAKKGKKAVCTCTAECCKAHSKEAPKGNMGREKYRAEYDTKLKAIMTDEQYKTYTTKQAERKGRIGEGHRPQRQGARQ